MIAHSMASNWTGIKSIVGLISSTGGNLTIGIAVPFSMSDYHGQPIAIPSNTHVTILGNNAVLNASRKGRFFMVLGALVLDSITLQNGCKVGSAGGAILNAGALTLNQTNFVSNQALQGGAIFSAGQSTLTVDHSSFLSNQAGEGGGGAIYSDLDGTLAVGHSTFTANEAEGGGGGAICSYGGSSSNFTVQGSSFTSNEASQGGALSSAGPLMVVKSSFIGNKATGVQYFCGWCGRDENVRSCKECSDRQETCHKCFGQGGAIALFFGAVLPKIFDTTMHSNTADNYGGALYVGGSVGLSCHQCQIFGNYDGSNRAEDNIVGPPVHYTCERGFKTGNTSVPVCTECSPGQISDGTAPFCVHCLPGQYSNMDNTRCLQCPANKFQSQSDQRNCSLCARGSFANDPGSSFCEVAPTNFYVRQVNNTFSEQKSCPEASAERSSTGSAAFSCINGILNFGDNVWHDGLRMSTPTGAVWQQNPIALVDSETKFYGCECKNACCIVHPDFGSVSCAFGSHGLLCSQCIDGYFKQASTGNCIQCGSWAIVETPLIVVLAFPASVLILLVWWKIAGKIPCCHGMKDWVARGACFLFCPSFIRKHNFGRPINLLVTWYKQNFLTKVKLLVGFYQISTLLHSSYNVPYPYTYLNVMEKVQFISVDFTKALPGPCIFGPGFDFASKLYTIGSLALFCCICSWALVILSRGQHPKPWAKKALPVLPTVLFLAYPGFSAFFFDVLKCRDIDGRFYLVADLSIKCVGADYNRLRVFAIVCVAFWSCGLPVIFVSLLWPERSNLLRGHRPVGFRGNLQDFYAPYKPQFWFFEAVEYTKKLLLIGIVPAINGTLVGAVISLVITGAYLLLLAILSPYAHKSDNILAVCSNALLSMVILISVLLKMDAAYIANQAAAGISLHTASNLLVACNLLVVVVSVAAYFVSASQLRGDGNDEPKDADAFDTGDHYRSLQEPLRPAHSAWADESSSDAGSE
jgi:predicted outer membrane repeat protein